MLNFFITASVLTICLSAGIRFYKYLSLFQKIFLLHTTVSLAVELIGILLKVIFDADNTTPIYNTYILVEFLIILFAARYHLNINNILISIISITYIITWIVTINHNGMLTFASQAFLSGCLTLLVLYLLALFSFSQKGNAISKNPDYLLFFATLIYLCGNIPLFCFILYLINKFPDVASKLFIITIIISNIRYALTTASFYYSSLNKTRSFVYT